MCVCMCVLGAWLCFVPGDEIRAETARCDKTVGGGVVRVVFFFHSAHSFTSKPSQPPPPPPPPTNLPFGGDGAKTKKEYRKPWSHYSAPLGTRLHCSLLGFAWGWLGGIRPFTRRRPGERLGELFKRVGYQGMRT